MIKAYSIAALLLLVLPSSRARAAHGATHAALGARGRRCRALTAVGAVAGAFVGYTAGPSISRSWGLEGSPRRRGTAGRRRETACAARERKPSAPATRGQSAERRGAAPRSYPAPNPPRSASKLPPGPDSRLSAFDRLIAALPSRCSAPARTQPTVAAAPPSRCRRPRPRPWPRRCRAACAASNSAARRSRCDRHD